MQPQHTSDETSRCTKCNEEKPLSAFRQTKQGGYKGWCLECQRTGNRAWYTERHPDARKYDTTDTLRASRKLPADFDEGTKCCTRCERVLPIEQFYKDKSRPDGLFPYCVACKKALVQGRKQKDAPVQRAYAIRPEVRAKNNAWNCSPEGRARYRKWFLAHPEQASAATLDWMKRHPDNVLAIGHRRRARKRAADGKFTAQEWADLKTQYNHTCLRCRRQEPLIQLSPDHVIPLAKGGSNNITNIQPLCLSCNFSKHTGEMDYRPLWNNPA